MLRMASDWYPASGPGRIRKDAELSDKPIILWVFLSVLTCIWACSLQGLWKQMAPMERSEDVGFLPSVKWPSLEADATAH